MSSVCCPLTTKSELDARAVEAETDKDVPVAESIRQETAGRLRAKANQLAAAAARMEKVKMHGSETECLESEEVLKEKDDVASGVVARHKLKRETSVQLTNLTTLMNAPQKAYDSLYRFTRPRHYIRAMSLKVAREKLGGEVWAYLNFETKEGLAKAERIRIAGVERSLKRRVGSGEVTTTLLEEARKAVNDWQKCEE